MIALLVGPDVEAIEQLVAFSSRTVWLAREGTRPPALDERYLVELACGCRAVFLLVSPRDGVVVRHLSISHDAGPPSLAIVQLVAYAFGFRGTAGARIDDAGTVHVFEPVEPVETGTVPPEQPR